MSGKRIHNDSEITPGMAKDVRDTKMLDVTARERFADGDNKTARYKTSKKGPSARGNRGLPN